MKTIWNWLVKSSTDPNSVSLSLKGIFVYVGTLLTIVAGLGHIPLGQADVTAFGDSVINLVQSFLMFISALLALYGVIRKVWLTIIGRNLVLK